MPLLSNPKSSHREVDYVDRNMMLTPDEYIGLRRLLDGIREGEGASEQAKSSRDKPTRDKPRRKNRKRSSQLSRAFRKANDVMRNKNGSLKKGRTQADVARYAHRLIKQGKI